MNRRVLIFSIISTFLLLSITVYALSAGTIFVTSTQYDPNFGGISGADSKCMGHAQSAGLGGSWVALISDNTTNAKDRIPDAIYHTRDGQIIANSKDDLFDGKIGSEISSDEHGNYVPRIRSVLTGTKADGTAQANNCNNWNYKAVVAGPGQPYWMSWGYVNSQDWSGDGWWIAAGEKAMCTSGSIYCVLLESIPDQTCPTCPSVSSSWTTCTSNTQTRTNYKCDSTTNFQCQSYTESQSCVSTNQTCPTCQSPSAWDTCTNNAQQRTNYYCNSTSSYQCQSYLESQTCTPTTTTPTETRKPCSRSEYYWCITESECKSIGGYWCGNFCDIIPCSSCSKSNYWYCETEIQCTNAGNKWCPSPGYRSTNGYCVGQSATCPPPDCNKDNLQNCKTEAQCGTGGGYWHYLSPNPYCSSFPQKCSSSQLYSCISSTDCKNAGGNWCVSSGISYGGYCQSGTCSVTAGYCGDKVCSGSETYTTCPSDCTSTTPSTGYCGDKICSGNETSATCSNDCVSPVITPTPSTSNITIPPQPIIQPNLTIPQEKAIPLPVPTALPTPVQSPQPSLEPTKPLPTVDRLRLAQSILAIESLKIKFTSLNEKSQSLLTYYNIQNSSSNIQKWDNVVNLFDQAIEHLDDIKSFISSVRDTATEGDLDEIVNRIDSVLLIIDKVIDVMLSG